MPTALSHDQGETSTPLLDRTIPQALADTATTYPDWEALVDVPTQRRWTYYELHQQVRAIAASLQCLGLHAGDRVGIWAPNCAEWVLIQFATAELGLILVNINPAYRQTELDYALRHGGVRLVVAAPRFRDADYTAMLDTARASCPELDTVIVLGTPGWTELLTDPTTTQLAALEAVTSTLQPTDPINIQYTSGTTGHPKGATLSHRNILNNGFFVGELCHYTEHDRICVPVPFYHCFGMVMGTPAAITHAATVVIPAPAFDARATLGTVAAERCTSLYGVPTMFIAELSHPDFEQFDLSTLRTGIMAGSPCPAEIMQRVIYDMGMTEVAICYGMTETSPVSTQTRRDDNIERRVHTVGRVGPHLEIRIVDPTTGETVLRGTAGEFCTRGYSVMDGYWNQPDKTEDTIGTGGWLHTGDLAVMDSDGYVQITGRIKDMVIRGGENIYPREIEEFLYTHPDILDAQVIGVPDPKYGEEIMAWIRLRDGAAELTADDIKLFATGNIARHKIPRYVHVVDEFPMTVTGKVRKIEMRETALSILGL